MAEETLFTGELNESQTRKFKELVQYWSDNLNEINILLEEDKIVAVGADKSMVCLVESELTDIFEKFDTKQEFQAVLDVKRLSCIMQQVDTYNFNTELHVDYNSRKAGKDNVWRFYLVEQDTERGMFKLSGDKLAEGDVAPTRASREQFDDVEFKVNQDRFLQAVYVANERSDALHFVAGEGFIKVQAKSGGKNSEVVVENNLVMSDMKGFIGSNDNSHVQISTNYLVDAVPDKDVKEGFIKCEYSEDAPISLKFEGAYTENQVLIAPRIED